MERKKQQRVRGRRRHSSSGRLVFRLQIYIFLRRMKMAKCPQSFLPAGVWISSLESYTISLTNLCSWANVQRKQQCWLGRANDVSHPNLWINSMRRAMLSRNVRGHLQCKTKPLITTVRIAHEDLSAQQHWTMTSVGIKKSSVHWKRLVHLLPW